MKRKDSSTDSPGKEKPTAEVLDFNPAAAGKDTRRFARKEAKVKSLKSRFSASRKTPKNEARSKSLAAQRLKNLFKRPNTDS